MDKCEWCRVQTATTKKKLPEISYIDLHLCDQCENIVVRQSGVSLTKDAS